MPGGLRDTGKPSALIPTFVAHSHMPAGTAYERFIFDQGLCPVREGLHDFFNGICWLHFPRIKSWLNQTQATQLANQFATQSGSGAAGAQRGPVRDALTVFDENGAMLVAPDALWQALAAKDWQRAFGALRPLWAQSRVTLVGHALLEKLVEPRKALTAHMIRAYPAINVVASLDEFLADDLHVRGIRAEPFAHLPVLGVPGWWEPNAHVAFYDDASVFRARRLA